MPPKTTRRRALKSTIILASLSVLITCSTPPPQLRALPEDPVFYLANYEFDHESRLIDRLVPIPDHVLAYLEELDQRDYEPYTLTIAESTMVQSYLELLPPLQQEVLRERLVGIYFLETFLGGGLTEFVLGENDDIYAFMAFNAETLHRDLSDWMTYRINTAFIPAAGYSLRAECDSDYTGFIHILLHEATHVVDFVEGITPYLQTAVPTQQRDRRPQARAYPFTDGIWKDSSHPRRRHDFRHRTAVTFYGLYGGPYLHIEGAARMYGRVADSPFVSLYGSTKAVEDLAELVAWYHLTNHLGVDGVVVCSRPDGPDRFYAIDPDPVTPERQAVLASFY